MRVPLDLPELTPDEAAHSAELRRTGARGDRESRRLDQLRPLHAAGALRAGPRLLQRRRAQARRRRRLRHRARGRAGVQSLPRRAVRGGAAHSSADAATCSNSVPAPASWPRNCSPSSTGATRCRRLPDPRPERRLARAPARNARGGVPHLLLERVRMARHACPSRSVAWWSPTRCSTRWRCSASRSARGQVNALGVTGDRPSSCCGSARAATLVDAVRSIERDTGVTAAGRV
jgi:hypothetical protein